MAKVDTTSHPGGCWQWTATLSPKGYGMFGIARRVHVASRVSYAMFVSPIPDGLFVLHRCDNPKCVNPDHLFLGTALDNVHDCMAKGRRAPMPQMRKRVA